MYKQEHFHCCYTCPPPPASQPPSYLVTLSVPASHLAAAEGCYSVAAWLLEGCGADANPVDRFKRTPLEVGLVIRVGPVLTCTAWLNDCLYGPHQCSHRHDAASGAYIMELRL